MPTSTIRHIFSISNLTNDADPSPLLERLELGRFQASLRGRPGANLGVGFDGAARVAVSSASGDLGPVHIKWEILHAGNDGLAQLHVEHQSDGPLSAVPEILRFFCHDRLSLRFDGIPFLEWLEKAGRLSFAPALEADVLQIVRVPNSLRDELGTTTSPSAIALGLTYRKNSTDFKGIGAVRLPRELNRDGGEFGIHGRGVIVLCGQGTEKANALLLTASELLLANSRARTARAIILHKLEQTDSTDARGSWKDMRFLSDLSEVVRAQRIALSVGVRSFSDGLFSPEIVLDDFRGSFGAALRLEDTTAATESLLETLATVLRSYVTEARLILNSEAERRQAQWQAMVGLASGIALPVALLLSFFGVSSEVNAPPSRSIFDWSQYWLPWTISLSVGAVVIILSLRRMLRSRSNEIENG